MQSTYIHSKYASAEMILTHFDIPRIFASVTTSDGFILRPAVI